METVAGVFQSRAEAENAVRQLHSLGVPNDRIALLTPGMSIDQVEKSIPTEDTEDPGMGKAMGGSVGGALGAASGATLGAAAASLLVPGVGPVLAGGILLGAAILGAGGAVAGAAAGKALEEGLESGLPHDELYVYEDAVRKGRSVVIAFLDQESATYAAQSALAEAGAESIDAAREDWWLGLRDAEAAHYEATGKTFQTDEANYRLGFEAALRSGGKPATANESSSAGDSDEAFRRGYERGQAYCLMVQEKYRR